MRDLILCKFSRTTASYGTYVGTSIPTNLMDRFQTPRYAAIGKINPNMLIFLKYQYATEISDSTPKHRNGIVTKVITADMTVNRMVNLKATTAIIILAITDSSSKTMQRRKVTKSFAHQIAVLSIPPDSITLLVFEALDGYKDSTVKANSIYDKYKTEKLKTAKVGDYVFFGAYEQDNNTSNGQEYIEWLVLEVKGGKALVISKYALDCQPYNTSYTNVTWETCTLRKWLNNDFINAAFSADERTMIPTVTVSADKNPDYSTNPGNATQDQVFLLSITEVNKYFSSYSARQCKPTDYAVANGAWGSGNCWWWWLRSPGRNQIHAASVRPDGVVFENGIYVLDDGNAVRPALWIDLNS